MLSAPSSSRDASLPPKTAASSSTPSSGASSAPAAPFDSVLAGLTPSRNGKTAGATPTPAKAGQAKDPTSQASADRADQGKATTAGGQVWSAPSTWMTPADASSPETEGAEDAGLTLPESTPDEPRVEPDASGVMPAVPVAPLPEPAPASAVGADDAEGNIIATTTTPDAERSPISFEENMEGALPDSPGALYGGAAARGVQSSAPHGSDGFQVHQDGKASADSSAKSQVERTALPDDAEVAQSMASDAAEMPAPVAAGGASKRFKVSPDSGDATSPTKIRAHAHANGVGATESLTGAAPTTPAPAAAPFAAGLDRLEDEGSIDQVPSVENIAQQLDKQVVKPALEALGIDPAKVDSTMEIVAADSSALTPDTPAPDAEPEVAAASRGAFDRVMQVADAARPAERSGVNVRLDFGDAGPLNVHIAMRDGRVHTMFRCDSPELRDTLAAAWSNFVKQGEVAALPLAEPVMLPLRASSGSQDGGRQQENFNQPQSDGQSGRQAGSREDTGASGFGRPLRRQSAAVSAPTVAPVTRGGSSSHLSALA